MKAIEYALICALVSIVAIAALTAMGGTFSGAYLALINLFGG